MLVSIVVPVLNEEDCILSTIDALLSLRGEKEIIVADGGSTDSTAKLVRTRPVTFLSAPRGRGQQMHAGAQIALGDVLWFVHADTIPPVHALENLLESLRDPLVAGGNFGLVFDGPSRSARQLTAIYPYLQRLGLCYGDSGIYLRHQVYRSIGGFAPLALFEDLHLLKRLRRAGKFVNLPEHILTSSRRFEQRNFALVWLHWTTLQLLYWIGVSPNLLARWYRHTRRPAS